MTCSDTAVGTAFELAGSLGDEDGEVISRSIGPANDLQEDDWEEVPAMGAPVRGPLPVPALWACWPVLSVKCPPLNSTLDWLAPGPCCQHVLRGVRLWCSMRC